jgi:cytochrome c
VFCFNATTGIFNAHIVPALMGTDNRLLKGFSVGSEDFRRSEGGTIVSVSYNFPRPGSTDPVPKESYVARVGNEACGVGYYK